MIKWEAFAACGTSQYKQWLLKSVSVAHISKFLHHFLLLASNLKVMFDLKYGVSLQKDLFFPEKSIYKKNASNCYQP
jgi:hypothetical protein